MKPSYRLVRLADSMARTGLGRSAFYAAISDGLLPKPVKLRCCAAPFREGPEVSRGARDWAWSRRGLTPAQRLVLLALAERANDLGDSCFPSLRQLELMTELSRRGITKALSGLDGRLIERDRGGPRRPTSYRLLLAVPTEDERPSEDVEPSSLHVGREQRSLGNSVPVGREQGSPG
jgi:hypothetical protein